MDDESKFSSLTAEALPNWQAPPLPSLLAIDGQYCSLEPLTAEKHSDELWAAFSLDTENVLWSYLPYGPFEQRKELYCFLHSCEQQKNEQYYAVVDKKDGRAVGFLAYLRIQSKAGAIEIGSVCFSPLLQKTTMATEAVYLLIRHCFELGYRRCEWKCNALNEPSKKAAFRFGFQYEGCFRQAMVVKGYNRDTCWYSIIDKEWPALNNAFLSWLNANNFNESGKQFNPLKYYLDKALPA